MAKIHGVEQKAVAQTIRDLAHYLIEKDIGPKTTKQANRWPYKRD